MSVVAILGSENSSTIMSHCLVLKKHDIIMLIPSVVSAHKRQKI